MVVWWQDGGHGGGWLWWWKSGDGRSEGSGGGECVGDDEWLCNRGANEVGGCSGGDGSC